MPLADGGRTAGLGAEQPAQPLTRAQAARKRALDVVGAAVVLLITGWAIPILAWRARRDTGASGIFRQVRVGRGGAPIEVLKIRTMRDIPDVHTTVTVGGDPRITPLGARLRKAKLDELPQLWNVLRGDLSLVGPRPDVPGFYDVLDPPFDVLLSLRPGLTGPATILFRDEDALLAGVEDAESYNDAVLFPAKLRANMAYLQGWTLRRDLALLFRTALAVVRPSAASGQSTAGVAP